MPMENHPIEDSTHMENSMPMYYINFSKNLDRVSCDTQSNNLVPTNPTALEISNTLGNVSIQNYLNNLNKKGINIEDYVINDEKQTYMLTHNFTGGPIVAFLVLIMLLLLNLVNYDIAGKLVYTYVDDDSSPFYNIVTFADLIKKLPQITTPNGNTLGYSVYRSDKGLLLLVDNDIKSGPIQRYLCNTVTSKLLKKLNLLNSRNVSYMNSDLGKLINIIATSDNELIKNSKINQYNYSILLTSITSLDSLQKTYNLVRDMYNSKIEIPNGSFCIDYDAEGICIAW